MVTVAVARPAVPPLPPFWPPPPTTQATRPASVGHPVPRGVCHSASASTSSCGRGRGVWEAVVEAGRHRVGAVAYPLLLPLTSLR